MTGTLFDVEHKCAGPWCRYCESNTGPEAKDLATESTLSDLEWAHRATAYLIYLGPHKRFTADDLTTAVGLPMGSSNQVGALFLKWHKAKLIWPVGYVTSKRSSNHGRVLREWRTYEP